MKFLFSFILFLMLSSCHEYTRKCKDYKTGDFYSEVVINNQVFKSHFSRNKDLQIEFYNGKTDSSRVRWINECEVVFKTINPKNMSQQKDIHLKILTTTNSSYTYEYSYVGESKKQKGIAYRSK